MSLKDFVSKRVLNDILGAVHQAGTKWKVLVLDQLGTRIVSSCCKMHDVMEKGITLVEGIDKSRAPQPTMEAIYIIWPSENSIARMLKDFDEEYRLYKAAHVFLLDRLPLPMIAKLKDSPAYKYFKCLKEAYIGFLPSESRVFTLDYPEAFRVLFTPGVAGKGEMKERIADQLATLCASLGEYPAIRCHREVEGIDGIASALHKRLEDFKMQDPNFATGDMKDKSELIILDRGFDVVSPLVHELTYQAMVYDLLGIKKDIYTYQAATEGGAQRTRDIILDETDEIWVKLRHKHFAEVKKDVGDMVKGFATSHKKRATSASADMSIKDLHRLIKETPQHHKELSKLSRHLSLVESCDKKFQTGMYELCKAEQNLATGEDETGGKVTTSLGLTAHLLVDRKIWVYDKIRLIMLQLLLSQGMTKEELTKVMERAEIPTMERQSILNLACLGYRILKDVKTEGTVVKVGRRELKRKERVGERYVVSRWIPVIQDIMESVVAGNLDQSYCPILSGYPGSAPSRYSSGASATASAAPQSLSVRSDRSRWNWVNGSQKKRSQSQKPEEAKSKAKLIVFVVGGLTHSEIRSAYEVSEQCSSHDVIIGSTHIITPADFIGQLNQLEVPYRSIK